MRKRAPVLVLNEPPSSNRYWRRAGLHLHRSKAANLYREHVHNRALVEGWRLSDFKPSDHLAVVIRWYRGKKMGDLDNRIKIVLDSLKGAAITDDKQVTSILAERFDDRLNPRCEIELSPR